MGSCNSSTKEDVRKDRERTRGAQQQQHAQQQQQQQQQQQPQQQQIPRPAQAHQQGIPTGSYRDANGIPRSIARDQPIAASYARGDDDGAYGTSYTNRKTKEYDLLNDIVKQTRHNFIDVSAKSGQLDEDDLVERGQKYVKNLSEIPSPSAVQQAAQPSVSALSFGRYYSALDLPLPSSAVVKRPQAPAGSALGAGLHAHAALPGEVDYQTLLAVLAAATVPLHDLEFICAASSQLSAALHEESVVQEPAPKIVLTFEELLNDK